MTFLSRTAQFTVVLALLGGMAVAKDEPTKEESLFEEAERKAQVLFDEAMELMAYKQYERAVDMLNKVVRDNQGTILSHRAHMAMGKHFVERGKPKDALRHFILLTRVLAPEPGTTQSEEESEFFCEALYEAALAQSLAGRHSAAFPLLRRLLKVAGKGKWADRAYFHIGEGHYTLKNWNKMLDALAMVGATAKGNKDVNMGRIEIGQRFYAMITDPDIPVLRRLDRPIKAKVSVSSGDAEELAGVAVGGKQDAMLVSAPTELGPAKRGDGKLQILGGDIVTVTYMDDSTFEGKKDVPRRGKVRAVSTGTVGFFLGDFKTTAYIAYPGQPQPLMVRDADLDLDPKAQRVQLTVRSLYKEMLAFAETNEYKKVENDVFDEEKEETKWRERDRVTVTLTERGSGGTFRTGIFAGKVQLAPMVKGQRPNMRDDILHCKELDEISVVYTDRIHIHGNEPFENEARVKVRGSVSAGLTGDQYIVFETLLKSRKACVEAEALVKLSEIYKDMGLSTHATKYADQALTRVNPVILVRAKLPGDLIESAFKMKWESELLKDDFSAAADTCLAFNRIYPESVLADQALMTVGRALTQDKRYAEAVGIYSKILRLQNPISAAEAQYRIGQTLVMQAEAATEAAFAGGAQFGMTAADKQAQLLERKQTAMVAFRSCYMKYPESSFAADALRLVIEHHIEYENYGQVAELLETVFVEYPDAAFLDQMLMVWAKVAYKLKDPELAKQKLRQLIYDFPQSNLMSDARKKLAALEARDEE